MNEREKNGPLVDQRDESDRILIVDDDPSMRTALMETVKRLGYAVEGAVDGSDAMERLVRFRPWLVLTDLRMPRLSGLDLIKEIRSRAPQVTIVLMTAYGTIETAVEAMKLGASEYLLKPFSMDVLERMIVSLKAGREDGLPAGPPVQSTESRAILTQDPGMVRLLSTIEGVAASQATVLIHGESGTGKELLARFIHARSPRAHRP
ncbi:MAG: response regulator, partial [Nitrospira sp.]|nr:response regulator [Nitrospira sp.]